MDAKGTFDPGFADIFNQSPGQDIGISNFGKALIKDHLLSRDNGQRILIDIKHMSIASRKDYYKILENIRLLDDSRQANVPIISSHTAVNGVLTLAKAIEEKDSFNLDKNSYVSKWDVNLTDEDIVEIFKSDGLIGICMHDGRMPGNRFREQLKKAKNSPETINKLHVQMFLTNVFHIIKVNLEYIRKENLTRTTSKIDEIDAWKTVCLGSDNDGIIDPFDNFKSAADLTSFRENVLQSLNSYVLPEYSGYNVVSLPSEKQLSLKALDDLMVKQTFVEVKKNYRPTKHYTLNKKQPSKI